MCVWMLICTMRAPASSRMVSISREPSPSLPGANHFFGLISAQMIFIGEGFFGGSGSPRASASACRRASRAACLAFLRLRSTYTAASAASTASGFRPRGAIVDPGRCRLLLVRLLLRRWSTAVQLHRGRSATWKR